MVRLRIKRLIILIALTVVVCGHDDSHPINAKGINTDAEARAVGFLTREVPAWSKENAWLRQASPNNVLTAATLLLAAASVYDQSSQSGRQSRLLKQDQCLKLIRAAQTSDGGWGPYADSPPEAFDTAIVLLALSGLRREPGVDALIRRGRSFLIAQQSPDGSWPATTRPSGGDSYAQLMSTTGWATLALLETR